MFRFSRKTLRRIAFGILVVTVVFLLPIAFLLRWQSRMTSGYASHRILSPGMIAPDFALSAQDGRTFRLSDYIGRAVFVAFVPSWSDSKTIAEVRSLAESIRSFDEAGAKVMVVSHDDPAKAAALYDREKLPFPLLMDTNGSLCKLYGVPLDDFRTTFVVSPAGKVKFRLGDAAVEPTQHGKQLLNVSKCCIDDVVAARAHGVGKIVGDFSLPQASDGAMGTLLGDGRQKATVVFFLSVKCPCSNAYNTRIAALAKDLADKPVRIVGVYANQDESAAAIEGHARANGFAFPVFKDENALCADHLHASVTPEVFVIDEKRILRYAGRIDDSRDAAEVRTHNLVDAVSAILASRAIPQADTRAFGCGIIRK